MCIASVLIAKVLKGVKITLGKECENNWSSSLVGILLFLISVDHFTAPKECWPYADAIKKVKEMGAKVEMKDVKGVTRCKKYNVVSTPAWLYEPATYSDIHEGIGKLVTMLKKCINK